MKFNLKNRPKLPKENDEADVYIFSVHIQEWFEGFEKELRKMKTSGVYESHFDRRLLEEILGEN